MSFFFFFLGYKKNYFRIILKISPSVQGLASPVVKSTDSSHCCGYSLAPYTCEMPSSAPVGQVVFLWYSGFRPPLINYRLDISEIFLKGP